MVQSIKELRKSAGLTQAEASALVGVPLRTYVNYENDAAKIGSIKYQYILQRLEQYALVDELHGILRYDDIVAKCSQVFAEYPVHFCYLFGSYAKGEATERSDVDLLVSTDVTGIKFYGLAERLRKELRKNVDLINVEQLSNNLELLNEVMKDGVRIYLNPAKNTPTSVSGRDEFAPDSFHCPKIQNQNKYELDKPVRECYNVPRG